MTPKQADAIFAAGADVITLGNHTWTRYELQPYLEQKKRILRPANFAPQCPGRGWGEYSVRGGPICNALVEIWQADHNGVYLHHGSENAGRRDGNFQGFGRFLTGSSGEYQFRTIKPVPYPGRTPHIHFAVKVKGRDKFTTQCYIQGEPRNAHDGVLKIIQDPKARNSVIIPFAPLRDSRVGELNARFDIVMGFTPEA